MSLILWHRSHAAEARIVTTFKQKASTKRSSQFATQQGILYHLPQASPL
jgi:hypothetical protein